MATLESRPPRRSRAWMVVVVVLLLAVMAGAFALQGDEDPTSAPTTNRLPVTSAASFDPQGDNGTEHEEQVLNALDQNPDTAWRSEKYGDPEAMAGKDGVGLILSLDGVHDIGQIDVRTPDAGWSGQVYVTDGDAPDDLAGWGEPLASVQGADAGLTRLDLTDARGSQVLVWFTRTADSGEVAVSEITVRAP
ncbi:MAG: serine/threonine protein kinase [Ilumatobacteraceae bacterium]|nr:serine/threonine protein kinase [Ilumatobacteraceae bacterium]